ncbi:tetratricopeptide repeat protein [Pelagicoccus mobilis]|uniref:Tetratricopeptide repeat protein n=1 Tax=Pelagicoccus mobilis TaxID=415221 RepID=A0A934VTH2_9BACT|nr:tetratricopeptide repeat protein [Pelagicoccus mobilis]MBK1879713.1 tetratricopeptide repeat protein [Pelagicoccus mobilis]
MSRSYSKGLIAVLSIMGALILCSCAPNVQPVKEQYGIQNADSYNQTFQEEYESLIKAVAKRPNDSEPLEALAYFYHANLLLKESQTVYASLFAFPDSKAKWHYYAGRIALDLGDQERALEHLNEAVARDDRYGLSHFYLGEVFLKLGELEKAESSYRSYLEIGTEKAYGFIGLGRVEIARKQWSQAEGLLLNSLREDSKIVSAYSLLTNIYRRMGREDQLKRVERAALNGERYHQPRDEWMEELYPFCLEPYRLSVIASILEASGREREGIEFLQKAVSLSPENSRLVFQLAEMLKKSDPSEEVTELLLRAIELDSTYESAHYAYVSELDSNGESEAALAASQRAVELAGEASGLWRQRGVLLEKARELSGAELAFRKAVEMEPTESKNQSALANFLWAKNEKAEAIVHYKEVRKLSPIEPKCRAILAAHYLEQKDFDEARKCIDEAVAIDPQLDGLTELNVQHHLLEGSAKLLEGDLEAAALSFESGLKIDPKHLDTMVRLVAVYLEQDELESARATARAAVKQHPRAAIAYRVMAGVEMKAGNAQEAQTWMERARKLQK